MKFLADMGVSMTTVMTLRHAGHGVEHLRELNLIRMEDREIVARARKNGQIVLTFDLDFGEIMALSGEAMPSIILFRMRNQTPGMVTGRLLAVIAGCLAQLESGAFITIEDAGYRLRRLPL
jgi:predicted nuclease of predicted toxin-antitoxin system